jgi:hypothetical protein
VSWPEGTNASCSGYPTWPSLKEVVLLGAGNVDPSSVKLQVPPDFYTSVRVRACVVYSHDLSYACVGVRVHVHARARACVCVCVGGGERWLWRSASLVTLAVLSCLTRNVR